MSNFSFLTEKKEYELFSAACIEAEKVLESSPAMCAVGSRKALELGVKWVFSADSDISMPYKDNLQTLIHEPTFRYAIDGSTWEKLRYITKLGNLGVHTDRKISKGDAILSLKGLFEFIEWIDYCYGSDYVERNFDVALIPSEKYTLDKNKIKEQESLLFEKDSEIEALRKKIQGMSEKLTAEKSQHKTSRSFQADDLSEFETRKRYIDVDLKLLGWSFGDDVLEEFEVTDMEGIAGKKGYVDYVLFGKDGLPLAVIEAKRTSKDPKIGKQQAKLYADCLQRRYGRRPMMFTTNGFETEFWDDLSYPQRKVSGVFAKSDLQKLMDRRTQRKDLNTIVIDDKITDRYYQKEAIRAVCNNIEDGHRKSLLVMSTGTGKTRTASSLVDVLSRGGYVTNVLFLADRKALVKQAKDDFTNYLPDISLCNLLSNKDEKNARIVFSTYPTILNSIDTVKNGDGQKLFTPAHFDLIIIDEAHRSIFKKYSAIFEYFDALLVGLTATPKTDYDRNTYDFFEVEYGVPTYAYDYETARDIDHVLVPYYNIEVKTKILEQGIVYDDLSEEEKERYEEDFTEDDGRMPAYIPSQEINQYVFNQSTVDMVLQDLMTKGIKTAGGDRLGKTIIFAQNKDHAQYIVDRFDALYPHFKGTFARRVVCDDEYVQSIIEDFKQPAPPTPYNADLEKEPHILVSVDMMDTGIDVPHVVNLVFFKKICSKTKFWQMIGRGTRLCKNLECVDSIDGDYMDKRRFYIFDYLRNFEFFRQNKEGIKGSETLSLTEGIFAKKVRIIYHLQHSDFAENDYIEWRKGLADEAIGQIRALNTELTAVKLKLEHVEKYKNEEAFICLSEDDKSNLKTHIAPLVYMDEEDEYAKRFDNFIYGIILSYIEKSPSFKRAKPQLIDTMIKLEGKSSIPQVREKLHIIKPIKEESFWENINPLLFEKLRIELRDLMKFLYDGDERPAIYTNLYDEVISSKAGDAVDDSYDFADYKLKVNRYIEAHKDEMAIWKLRNNMPLTAEDYQSLSEIFTHKLGTSEDYKREYGDTPFGLIIRKVAKLEREAAMDVFSDFINTGNLNHQQSEFMKKIIEYVIQNGYMENVAVLTKAPFDKPQKFIALFDSEKQKKIVTLINSIKENAERISA